jgi:phospholipid/cholesterol/gamma-HCH transport system substrate-binding protein
MKTISIKRGVIVGIFIFLGIVIFITGVFTVGTQRKTFAQSVTVKSIFDNVGGLQEGNNVWLSGVKIGTVKKISFHGTTQVEIVMNIDKDVQSHITKDAKTRISSDGFIGNRIVEIFGGTASAPMVSEGDYLEIGKSVSTDDLLATLQENNKNLLDITGDLKIISRGIREGKGTIGKLINDPSIADNLRATLVHFNKASVNSEKAIAKLNEYVSGLNKQGTLVNELMTDTVAFAHFRETLDQLKKASYSISEFADSLKQAGLSLHRTDNPAGALLNDRQMAEDLKTITRNLNSSSQKLDEDLKALQSNFLFRPYFKNQEKQKKKEENKK